MGDVIPFPTPEPEYEKVKTLWIAGAGVTITAVCDDLMHVFTNPDEPCECGQEEWTAT